MWRWKQRLERLPAVNPWKSLEARGEVVNRFSPRALRRNQPCWHLDFGPLAFSSFCERINFCCFKLLGLWYFIIIVLRNEYIPFIGIVTFPSSMSSHQRVGPLRWEWIWDSRELEDRKLSQSNAGFGLSQCFAGDGSLFFKEHRDDLESPWLSVWELSVWSKTHLEVWNFHCTPFNGSPLFHSFHEYLSSARRDRKLTCGVLRSNWSYPHLHFHKHLYSQHQCRNP